MSAKTLPLDNDWEMVWPGTRRNTATGVNEAAASLTGLTGRISDTDGGSAIHADLSKSMAERASTPGEYFAIVDGDALRTHLATSYIGRIVWEVFGDGTNVVYSQPRLVVARRRS